ncbi:ABC transporter related protein [Arcobacter nitrofigilis DSM 7299]|uniref:ABC transporter related protein n=1 Tax=Arcobacter nitrofigilis (strain ATCC 33309 / DSM 7299 / CCUG 15893 / LMG 7604 / NCTC 12251 / CI) TaxID=572480 RepID=D5V602_ARCNC|nr:ATP-binding cassette domain-containing protein [Arcobacter nitrofigilis]ADG93169.1 ABC transporter related protein [Arcobacter nitrofigilis DSM 7299]
MIYTDINKFLNDFIWLTKNCTIENFSKNRPASDYKLDILKEKIPELVEKNVTGFYNSVLKEFSQENLFWQDNIEVEKLPMIVFIPNKGISIIIEKTADDKFKAESVDGLEYISDFPEGTKFRSLKTKRRDLSKTTAIQMFVKIAKEQKRFILYAFFASFSINIFALATSFYSMQVYDRVIPTNSISTLISLTIGVSIAVFLELIVKISRSSLLDYAAKNMDIGYSHNIFNRFLKVRCDQLPKSIGTVSSKLQSYASIRGFISSVTLYVFIDFPFALLFVSMIVLLGGWQMGIVAICFLIVSIISGILFKDKIVALTKSSTNASHKKLGMLVETVENAESVKANGLSGKLLNNWNNLTLDNIEDDIKIKHYSEISSYIAAFLQQFSYLSLIFLGAYLVSTSTNITTGSLIAISILSGRMLSPIAMLPNLFVQFGKAKFALQDIEVVFELELDNENIDKVLHPHLDTVDILLKDIKFSYTEEIINLKIHNLEIKEGEKVAILGGIGSGKSTLLKILAGLYKAQEGQILLNGIQMQYISRHLLSKEISYLPQSTKLLSGTLRENLLMGMVGISDEIILEKAKETGLINIINNLPQGLDSIIPEGGDNFSGGQKQIIALTKTIIQNSKIWMLDEPTANLDDNTERNILAMLKENIKQEQTLILVTHKPLLLNLVDRIIILNQNGIVMDDTKEKVLEKIKQPQITTRKENEKY